MGWSVVPKQKLAVAVTKSTILHRPRIILPWINRINLSNQSQLAEQEDVVEGDLFQIVVAATGAAVAGLHVGD